MQTEPSKADPPKRKRRWFQFSLRTLLVFTLIFAIPCAWLGRKIERKRQEQAAVDAIRKLGGAVYYDFQRDELAGQPTWRERRAPFGPAWLRKLLGENFFSEVDNVSFYESKVTDAGLVNLNELTQLRHLCLSGNTFTDAGLANVKGMTELRMLFLEGSNVTDAGMDNLKGLTNLQYFYISRNRTKVTDDGVKYLQNALPNCKIDREHMPP